MGTFQYGVEVGRLDGSRFETIEAVVDTDATYTWVPRPVLERLGIVASGRRRLRLADGQVIEREVGQVLVRIHNEAVVTVCIIGDPASLPLLGAVTLEEFGLAPDPVNKQLVPVIGLLASPRGPSP